MIKIMLLIIGLLFTNITFAHPLDISNNNLYFSKNQVNITSYIHSYEIEYLLKQDNIQVANVMEYYNYKENIKKYIDKNLSITSTGNICKIGNFEIFESEEYKILSQGLEINYNYECEQNIDSGIINLTFFDNFPLQTNHISLYNLNGDNKLSPIDYTVLTSKISTLNFDLNQIEKKSKEPSINKDNQSNITNSSSNGILKENFTNNFFTTTLEKISKYVNNKSSTNIFYILLLVTFLGFIHAMGPGHSKSILISYIIDKNKTFKDGLLYITIFTITHLLDIIILFVFTKILTHIIDISKYMLNIQRFSTIILLIFCIILLYKSIKKISSNKIETNNKSIKSSIFIGFIAGIAPCTFGWSIFLLLFSLGNLNLILPMILALGLGIFFCLLIILIITYTLRKKIFDKLNVFSQYSIIFSSSILLIVSIFLLIKLF